MTSSRFRLKFGLTTTALLLGAFVLSAAPIRVGIFKSYATAYWHTNIHTAGAAIVAMLAKPDTANLGSDLVIPSDGFIVTQYGLQGTTTGTATAAQLAAFIAALDTLDVGIFPSVVNIGASIRGESERLKIMAFARTKGIVSIHATTDSYGTWAAWDSLHGTRFSNHPSSDRLATIHLDTIANADPHLKYLNRGLPDSARFLEEWFSFTTESAMIRSNPGLKVTVRIDEGSYNGGMGGARVMGADHPMSWYRVSPEGGRFFYTPLGHRSENYLGKGTYATNFLRRQLYNAILWAAKVDSNSVVAVTPADAKNPQTPIKTWVSGNRIHVKVAESGSTVELYSLTGTRLAVHYSVTAGIVTLYKPPNPGTFIVRIRSPKGIRSALVAL